MLNGEKRVEVKLEVKVGNTIKHHIAQQIHVLRDWALMDKVELGDVSYFEDTKALIPLAVYPSSNAPDSVALDLSVESAAKLAAVFERCRKRTAKYGQARAADWFAYAARTVAGVLPGADGRRPRILGVREDI